MQAMQMLETTHCDQRQPSPNLLQPQLRFNTARVRQLRLNMPRMPETSEKEASVPTTTHAPTTQGHPVAGNKGNSSGTAQELQIWRQLENLWSSGSTASREVPVSRRSAWAN